jgi:hypothetical protein
MSKALRAAFQRALDDHLGQLAQQAALAGQLQPASLFVRSYTV